jgi:hypothetical protein
MSASVSESLLSPPTNIYIKYGQISTEVWKDFHQSMERSPLSMERSLIRYGKAKVISLSTEMIGLKN